MKVFVFDLLAYDANLDPLKDGGPELPYPAGRCGGKGWRRRAPCSSATRR
jgi:hypothetical protein